jgi:NADH-quinone oxidoreductase subunit I
MSLSEFFRKILLLEMAQGMWVTLKNQFRPHITVEYPRETVEFAPRFRGVPRLRKDPATGEELCVSCLLCEAICPTECISIVSEKRPDGKGKQLVSFTINYERCCFCGLCVDPCPTKPITAIYMSHDYELAGFDRDAYVTARKELVDGKPVKIYTR